MKRENIESRISNLENKIELHEKYFDKVAQGINASARTKFGELEYRTMDIEEDIDFVSEEIVELSEKQENLQKQIDEILHKAKVKKQQEKDFFLITVGIYVGLLVALVIFAILKIF